MVAYGVWYREPLCHNYELSPNPIVLIMKRHGLSYRHLLVRILPLAWLLLGGSSPLHASNVYKYVAPDGTVTYSAIKPLSGRYENLGPSCAMTYMGCEKAGWDWSTVALNLDAYREPILQAATRHSVDPALVRAVVHAESSFNRHAVSRAGAQGLMQLMPETQRSLGVSDPFDVEANLDGGTRLLGELLARYSNDIRLATAAYNAGPGAVQRYNGIPPFEETRNYVQRVSQLYTRYRQHLSPDISGY